MRKLLNTLGLIIAIGIGSAIAQQVPKNYSLENNGQIQKTFSAFTTGAVSMTTAISFPAATAGGSPASVICSGCSAATSVGVTINQSPMNVIVTNATSLGSTTSQFSNPVVIATDQRFPDPCVFQAKSQFAINTVAASASLITGVAGKKVYVCSILVVGAAGTTVNLIEGLSGLTSQGTSAAMIGSATNPASGPTIGANGGWSYGNGGGMVATTNVVSDSVYLTTSPAAQIGGNILYIIQ